MSKTLLDRINQVHDLEKKIIENGGELTPELEKAFDSSELALRDKVDGYAYVIENLRERGQYWENKAALLKKYAKGCANLVERLRWNLKSCMIIEGTKEIQGEDIRFVLSPMAPTLEYDESLIPDEYFKTEVIRSLDKESIKIAIKSGKVIPGVSLIDVLSLRTYPLGSRKETKKELTR